jgi:hypothetical protein
MEEDVKAEELLLRSVSLLQMLVRALSWRLLSLLISDGLVRLDAESSDGGSRSMGGTPVPEGSVLFIYAWSPVMYSFRVITASWMNGYRERGRSLSNEWDIANELENTDLAAFQYGPALP